MKRIAWLIGALLPGVLAATPAHALVINISAADAAGVFVALNAGADYTLAYAPAGTEGATYLAWNPWGVVEDCNPAGTRCAKGFSERFNIAGTGGDLYRFAGVAGPYASALQANADAVAGPIYGSLNGGPYSSLVTVVSFHQSNDVDAHFYVPDEFYPDNTGGVSLVLSQVSAVPEAQSWGLMLGGLAALGWVRRGRRCVMQRPDRR